MTHEERIHYWGELMETYRGDYRKALAAWTANFDDPVPTEAGRLEEQTEAGLTWAIVKALRAEGCIAFHADAGSKDQGRRAKAGRPPKGWPDIEAWAPGGRVHLLEVKTPEGRLRPGQVEMHARLERLGFRVAVVRSVEEALEAVRLRGEP